MYAFCVVFSFLSKTRVLSKTHFFCNNNSLVFLTYCKRCVQLQGYQYTDLVFLNVL